MSALERGAPPIPPPPGAKPRPRPKTAEERSREAATPYTGPHVVFAPDELEWIRRATLGKTDDVAKSITRKLDAYSRASIMREPAP